MPSKAKKEKNDKKGKKKKRLTISRTVKPDNLSLYEWQRFLRKFDGEKLDYEIENLSDNPVFSDFIVYKPNTHSRYKVAIRSEKPGPNFCTCPDFAVNNLGTCKHIEYLLSKIHKNPEHLKILKKGYQPTYSSIAVRYGEKRRVVIRLAKNAPDELKQLAAKYFDADGVLPIESFGKLGEFLSAVESFEHEVRCYDDVFVFISEYQDAVHRQEELERLYPTDQAEKLLSDLLKYPLLSYQVEGVLFSAKTGRAILADDMGLGKTIQAIGAVELLNKHFGVSKVLIICPASLKHQWAMEINKFTGHKSLVIEGPLERRQYMYKSKNLYNIVNYDVIFRDLKEIQKVDWDMVILDEAQRIKNWNTRTAQTVKCIQAPYSLVLTGTPMENKLEELLSIVQFVDRYCLGPAYQFLHNHQIQDDKGKVLGYRDLHKISETLAPLMLRRNKKEVLTQLPERSDKNIFLSMTPQQKNFHAENQEIVARIVHKWQQYHFLSEADRLRLMVALQKMRMSCDSTYLLDEKTDFGNKVDELRELVHEILEIKDEKVVIFSQWLKMMKLIQNMLKDEKIDYLILHGGIPSTKRKSLLDDFRKPDGPSVFLSTEAGGVGLNLQSASHVINVDLPWNPAVLEQRIGRVHRMGQGLPVQVINLVSKATIEHRMLDVLAFKQDVFRGVFEGGENEIFRDKNKTSTFMKNIAEMIKPDTIETDSEDEAVKPDYEGDTIVLEVLGEEDGELVLETEVDETETEEEDATPETAEPEKEDVDTEADDEADAGAQETDRDYLAEPEFEPSLESGDKSTPSSESNAKTSTPKPPPKPPERKVGFLGQFLSLGTNWLGNLISPAPRTTAKTTPSKREPGHQRRRQTVSRDRETGDIVIKLPGVDRAVADYTQRLRDFLAEWLRRS